MLANSSAKATRLSLQERILRTATLVAWVFAIFLLVQFVLAIGIDALSKLGLKLSGIDETVFVFSLSVIIYSLVLAITIAVPAKLKLWSADIDLKKLLGVNLPLRLRDIGLAAVAFVVYVSLALWAMELVSILLPSLNLDQPQDIGIKTLNSGYGFALAFVTFVVLAPLAEELLFRGYLFGNLRRILPFGVAALITSALFGFIHFQWNVGIDVFILSLVLCYLREKTQRLWPSVVLHMGKNFLAFATLFIFHVT